MTTTKKITADDLDWEEPARTRSGGGVAVALAEQVGEMRAALSSRRGSWAVLDSFERRSAASSYAQTLTKRRDAGDSRLAGCEFAGRSAPDGASKLYVRFAPVA